MKSKIIVLSAHSLIQTRDYLFAKKKTRTYLDLIVIVRFYIVKVESGFLIYIKKMCLDLILIVIIILTVIIYCLFIAKISK